MARVKRGVQTRAKHKKILKQAKGYRGRSKNVFRIAIEKVEKGLQYAYRDRRTKKRNFRGLWIQRINAGVREHGMNYSQFINGIKKSEMSFNIFSRNKSEMKYGRFFGPVLGRYLGVEIRPTSGTSLL